MTLNELENTVRKYYLLSDPYIIRLICSFVISSRLPIKPPWLFLVAGSSGGKSSLLQSLATCEGIIARDDFTVASFFTGMKGQEGIVQKMMNNFLLVVKDLSMMMSKDEKVRAELLGILRQLYDGSYEKSYGNGVQIDWKGKMTLLAGTTTAIYPLLYQFSMLGERYLLYNFMQPDREEATYKALEKDSMADGVAEKEMQEAFKSFIDSVPIPKELPEEDPSVTKAIVKLSELVSRGRSKVDRDHRDPKKGITHIHDLEMPMRFAKQIKAVTYGLMVMSGEKILSDDEKKLVYKLALDSMPIMRKIVLRKLMQYTTVTTVDMAESLQLPTQSIHIPLHDLSVLGVVRRYRIKENRDEWELLPKYRETLEKYEGIKSVEEVAEENEAEKDLYAEAEDVFS